VGGVRQGKAGKKMGVPLGRFRRRPDKAGRHYQFFKMLFIKIPIQVSVDSEEHMLPFQHSLMLMRNTSISLAARSSNKAIPRTASEQRSCQSLEEAKQQFKERYEEVKTQGVRPFS
jgi:hypothetical protein